MRKLLSFNTFLGLGALAVIGLTGYALYDAFLRVNEKLTETEISIESPAVIKQPVSPANPRNQQGVDLEDSKDLVLVPQESKSKLKTLTLGKKNTISFKDVVNDKSVAGLQSNLLRLNKELDAGKPIYLVLDTPGGSVMAGLRLIETAKGLGRPIHTVSLFAASMGYHIVQSLDKRIVSPSGILMSHRMKVGGLGGEIPGELVNEVGFMLRLAFGMDQVVADRIGMSVPAYQNMIADELWLVGSDSINLNMADEIMNIKCGADLTGSYKEELPITFFGMYLGTLNLTWSECPMISYPLEVDWKKFWKEFDEMHKTKENKDSTKSEVARIINMYLYDKRTFVKKYVIGEDAKNLTIE